MRAFAIRPKSEKNVLQDLIPRVRHGEAALCTPKVKEEKKSKKENRMEMRQRKGEEGERDESEEDQEEGKREEEE